MNIIKNSSQIAEKIALPLVRIDAMDLSMSIPLREYFVANGCHVVTNTNETKDIFYHIVLGDEKFVKSFLDNRRIASQKSLYICWTLAHTTNLEEQITSDQKIVYIDPKPIDQELLNTILKFFFTGRSSTKNFQSVIRSSSSQDTQGDSNKAKQIPKQREDFIKHTRFIQQDKDRIAKVIEREFPLKQQSKKQKTPHKKVIWLSSILFFFGFCIFMFIGFFLSLAITGVSLYEGTKCIKNENNTCISSWTHIAESSLHLSKNLFMIADTPRVIITSMTNQPTQISTYDRLFTAFDRVITIEKQANALIENSQQFLTTFFPTTTDDTDTTTVVQMDSIKTQLFSLQSDLDMTHLMIEDIAQSHTFPFSLPQSKWWIQSAVTRLDQIRNTITAVQRLSLLYPYISGFKDKQTYLILLQNTMELRPTGGFIGSFMTLSVADGKIENMGIQDIYAIDGQLKGHVDPPMPIAMLLNQEHWYLRDSNWNPDFSQSAQKALWFYNKETGETPQGVIAINSSIITKLLQLTGPIKLTDFNDEITADNFYTKSLYYTQTNFFPGSTQKKDFLGSLLTELTNRIFVEKKISKIQLFSVLENSLDERDVQFYFTTPEAQQIVQQFDLGGIIPAKPLCSDPLPNNTSCIPDYLGLVESNMGVNKANYFITREEFRDVIIGEQGSVSETVTRTFANTSQGEPGSGTYRNYMRFLIPKNAHVSAFTIDDTPIPVNTNKLGNTIVVPYGEIDTDSFPEYAMFAAAFDVPQGKEVTVKITYTQAFPQIDNQNPPQYNLYEQKQSGISSIPIHVRIHFPTSWQMKGGSLSLPISLANEGYLEYNSTMSHDINLTIQFIKGMSL